jgi:hypothetical protein
MVLEPYFPALHFPRIRKGFVPEMAAAAGINRRSRESRRRGSIPIREVQIIFTNLQERYLAYYILSDCIHRHKMCQSVCSSDGERFGIQN